MPRRVKAPFNPSKATVSKNGKRWRTVEDRKQREQAATALKLEQKHAYARESTLKINECRPEKDAAWKAMQARHEKERLDLRTLHRQETSALARQQVTARLALHEKWRAQALDKQATRIDARLTAHQGMAAQQQAAFETIKLHARASRTAAAGGPVAVPPNPLEASRAYSEKAQSEQEKRAAIRGTLLKTRAQNLERAAPAPLMKQMLSSKGKLASRALSNGEASPRATIAPGIRAAKDNRSSNVPQHRPAEDTQNHIRQAVDSGRRLTDAERANASPDIKAQLGQEDRKAAARSLFMAASFKQKQRDRGAVREVDGDGNRRAAPAVHAARHITLGPEIAVLFPPAFRRGRIIIALFLQTLLIPARGPSSHASRDSPEPAIPSQTKRLVFPSPAALDAWRDHCR